MSDRKIVLRFRIADDTKEFIQTFAEKELKKDDQFNKLFGQKWENAIEDRTNEIWEKLDTWLYYNDWIEVEFDLDDPTVPPKIIST